MESQLPLFKRKTFVGAGNTPPLEVLSPKPEFSVLRTLPAYYLYLKSRGGSKYTPDDFHGDVKKFGLFLRDKRILDITKTDVEQWKMMLQAPRPKGEQLSRITIKRKISALRNYFSWLVQTEVISANPAEYVYTGRPLSPLPLVLTEDECQRLLSAAQHDPRPYLILTLLLDTGMKLEELLTLSPDHFDFSNKYIPEVWIANANPKRSRKLKLPGEIAQVFSDYTAQYATTDKLFPYTDRFIRHLIADAVSKAGITKPVSAKILRDTYVVLRLKRGESIDLLLQRIRLDPEKSTDAREKYEKLARGGI